MLIKNKINVFKLGKNKITSQKYLCYDSFTGSRKYSECS